MKTSRLIFGLTAFAVAALFAGCDTFDSRAKEKSETYNSLSPKTQKRLERGTIHVGDTEDMVYIALGNPDEKRDWTNANGSQQIWIYRTYWEQYEGTAWAGYHRVIEPAPNGRGFVVYHEPVTQDIYRTHVDEVIRVTFANQHVTAVEQNKR